MYYSELPETMNRLFKRIGEDRIDQLRVSYQVLHGVFTPEERIEVQFFVKRTGEDYPQKIQKEYNDDFDIVSVHFVTGSTDTEWARTVLQVELS